MEKKKSKKKKGSRRYGGWDSINSDDEEGEKMTEKTLNKPLLSDEEGEEKPKISEAAEAVKTDDSDNLSLDF